MRAQRRGAAGFLGHVDVRIPTKELVTCRGMCTKGSNGLHSSLQVEAYKSKMPIEIPKILPATEGLEIVDAEVGMSPAASLPPIQSPGLHAAWLRHLPGRSDLSASQLELQPVPIHVLLRTEKCPPGASQDILLPSVSQLYRHGDWWVRKAMQKARECAGSLLYKLY